MDRRPEMGGATVEGIFCPQCRMAQPSEHRWCIRCGEELPIHMLARTPKSGRLFAGTRIDSGDPEGAFLRVSRYREDQVVATAEGSVSVPGHHVRFSVWVHDRARCAVSVPETEARSLAEWLIEELGPSRQGTRPARDTR